jgi:phospholipid/cholesterol/gamma-HCH transport system substrate-binding protein
LKRFNLSKEVRVGLVITLGIVLFYFGFNFVKGKNLFSPSRTYYSKFDNVDQLMPSAQVQLNGLQVGIVDKVYFVGDKSYKIIVKLLIYDDEVLIPEDSEAHIVSDLLGTRTLQLTLGKSKRLAERGDTLKSFREIGITDEIKNAILPLRKQVESLAGSIDTVLVGLNKVFNRKTQDDLVTSFESVSKSINTFEHTVTEFDILVSQEREKLSVIFTNIKSITDNLKNNNEKLSNIFSNLDKISDDVAKSNVKQTMTDLQTSVASLHNVLAKIERGEGSLGQLVSNDSLYNNLESSSKNLSLLLEDLKIHPKRYVHFSVFGKKDK